MAINIEGAGSLYNISEFINREQVNDKIDLKRMESFKILSTHPVVENKNEYEAIYNSIMKTIAKARSEQNGQSKLGQHGQSGLSKPSGQLKQPLSPKIGGLGLSHSNSAPTSLQPEDNPMLKIFDYTPKKPVTNNVSTPTNYEKQQFNNIIYGSEGTTDGTDHDSERLSLLESIADIKRELSAMEDINLDTIPMIDDNSSIYDMRRVYKLLLYKKNTTLHFETARDFMMIGINQIVRFCNGQGGRPNLTGWERSAQAKLSILKTEVTKLASDTFKTLDIGPTAQILISLIPSAAMYAITQNKHQNMVQSDNSDTLNKLRDLI